MHVVILSSPGWHTEELSRALERRQHTSEVMPYESLVARPVAGVLSAKAPRNASPLNVLAADAVLARFIPSGSLEQIIYRVDALHWMERRGIPVMNSPRAIERSVDKFYTTALLCQAGLPTPETVVCERAADAMVAVQSMGDVIIKPIFGSMGHGMTRVSDPDTAFRVIRALEDIRAVFYVQQAVDHRGRDIRVFVVGDRVIGAIERCGANGDWRTNASRGGSVRPIDLPHEWSELALAAAAAVGAEYAGVDLLQSRSGEVFVIEVNGVPGWQALQRATGIDVAGAIVEYLETRVDDCKQRVLAGGGHAAGR